MAPAHDNSVAAAGEFALIDRLRRIVPTAGPGLTLGIGDDAAVLSFAGPVVATCDIQVEGVHFTQALCAPGDVGWRAIAVNLSDIAAMGGTPRFVLVSLALPAGTPVGMVEDLYRGIAEISTTYALVVAGGNLSSTPGPMVIDVTALGDANGAVRRGGARPGDRVWISGAVGKSAAGRFLAEHQAVRVPDGTALVSAYRRPAPRVEVGKALGRDPAVSAMIDTSDGTASDLIHVVDASTVGVRVDTARLPLPPGLAEAARAAGGDPLTWALDGGEDYELLFTASPEFDRRAASLADGLHVPLTCIGEILPQAEGRWIIERDGRDRPLLTQGWDHFAQRRR
jgi:thiamine-monophosphate kinase